MNSMNIMQSMNNIGHLGNGIVNSFMHNFHLSFNQQLYNQLSVIVGGIMLACYLAGLLAIIVTILGWATYHFKLKENDSNEEWKRKRNYYVKSGIISSVMLILLPTLILIGCGAVASFSYNPIFTTN